MNWTSYLGKSLEKNNTSMQIFLLDAVKQGHLRHIDMQFAMMIANNEPATMLAAALVSKNSGEGNVCLPLSCLSIDSAMPSSLQKCFSLLEKPLNWHNVLLCSQAVSTGEKPSPLILDDECLYLNKFWYNEQKVAYFFEKENYPVDCDKENTKCILQKFFGMDHEINWQKVAVAVSLTRRISVIHGGPGTGKTATVSKLLASLVQLLGHKKCRIRIAAPTGKAAARLSESLNNAIKKLELTKLQLSCFPGGATTLHHLLGMDPRKQLPYYHEKNPLHLDILVVDEASMVDLIMMSRIINALPPHARVIFLGDRDQLSSVGAGSVLGDICTYAGTGYTVQRAKELSKLTGHVLEGHDDSCFGTLRDSLCFLKRNYRFQKKSIISKLAASVNCGNFQIAKDLLNHGYSELQKRPLNNENDYLSMINEAIQGYQSFFVKVKQRAEPELIISSFSEYKILCAVHTGLLGVTGINEHLERALIKKKAILFSEDSSWYEGRPIIILRNDDAIGVVNGDIGIALNRGAGLRVWFYSSKNGVKSIHPNRLPEHETVWAMTVHKSQGSEFNHVAVVLPSKKIVSVITRELLYTAITRSRYSLSLYADDFILEQAIVTKTERHSGLIKIFKKLVMDCS